MTRAIEFTGPDKVPHQKRDYWFLIRIVDRCHTSGMHCGMHSCGDLEPLVPLTIETGLDFLQLDSPDICGLVAWPYSEPAVIEVGEAAAQLERDLFEKLGNYPIQSSTLRV